MISIFTICHHTELLQYYYYYYYGHAVQHEGSWFPDEGSNPCPLHWERGVLTTGPPGKSHSIIYYTGQPSISMGSASKDSVELGLWLVESADARGYGGLTILFHFI